MTEEDYTCVDISFDKEIIEDIRNDLNKARELFKERHLGNNKTMQREKEIILLFINLASVICEEEDH